MPVGVKSNEASVQLEYSALSVNFLYYVILCAVIKGNVYAEAD